eukprot:Seg788.21 transcript_id=Seg788.21/GoldUCD/mRNA.D3Y31 product="Centrosomal protein of 44 kDa" protein_id=Seg788.21/GoldUCD/D3Y31
MTTGDISNNIRKLIAELKQVAYDYQSIDYDALTHGIPSAFLPIMHHVLLDYSHELASYFVNKNYDLYGRTDLRFVETVLKILRQEFSHKPSLTKEQFLALGFAERKIILLTDVAKFCREKNRSFFKKSKQSGGIKRASIVSKDGYLNDTKSFSDKSKMKTISKNAKEFSEGNAKKNNVQRENKSFRNVATMDKDKVPADRGPVGLPVPSLNHPKACAEPPATRDETPLPCDSLMVTPLKDTTPPIVDSEPTPSRAEVIDLEAPTPRQFGVISHVTGDASSEELRISEGFGKTKDPPEQGQYPSDVDQAKSRNGIDTKQGYANTSDSSASTIHVFGKQTETDGSLKQIGYQCNCKATEDLVQDLKGQVESLSSCLKDVVAMNNELSARVVLLETRGKLMEERVELLEDEVNDNRQENHEANSVRGSAKELKFDDSDGQNVKRSRGRGNNHFMHNIERGNSVQYSPDKYTDDDNPLPSDFQPIRIEAGNSNHRNSSDEATDSESDADDKKSNVEGVYEDEMLATSIAHPDETQHNSDSQENLQAGFSDNLLPALSPLKTNDFSFMEQSTKDTVLNLQKRLEETMNLLKISKGAAPSKE